MRGFLKKFFTTLLILICIYSFLIRDNKEDANGTHGGIIGAWIAAQSTEEPTNIPYEFLSDNAQFKLETSLLWSDNDPVIHGDDAYWEYTISGYCDVPPYHPVFDPQVTIDEHIYEYGNDFDCYRLKFTFYLEKPLQLSCIRIETDDYYYDFNCNAPEKVDCYHIELQSDSDDDNSFFYDISHSSKVKISAKTVDGNVQRYKLDQNNLNILKAMYDLCDQYCYFIDISTYAS